MKKEVATFAGGCFWCLEAVFQKLKGIEKITSGYTGGNKANPSYEEVSSGNTNHAEAVQIEFNPNIISYSSLLEVFFSIHDPTTLNKQGSDIGSQYRSAIFYHTQKQKNLALKTIEKLQQLYKNKIVTEVTEFKIFYKAENYHQNYYINNTNASYCRIVIDPKIQKLYKNYNNILK